MAMSGLSVDDYYHMSRSINDLVDMDHNNHTRNIHSSSPYPHMDNLNVCIH